MEKISSEHENRKIYVAAKTKNPIVAVYDLYEKMNPGHFDQRAVVCPLKYYSEEKWNALLASVQHRVKVARAVFSCRGAVLSYIVRRVFGLVGRNG